VVAATAGVIELLCPIDDNLVVPVSMCILLSVFPTLL
jgi:dolichol kinase